MKQAPSVPPVWLRHWVSFFPAFWRGKCIFCKIIVSMKQKIVNGAKIYVFLPEGKIAYAPLRNIYLALKISQLICIFRKKRY